MCGSNMDIRKALSLLSSNNFATSSLASKLAMEVGFVTAAVEAATVTVGARIAPAQTLVPSVPSSPPRTAPAESRQYLKVINPTYERASPDPLIDAIRNYNIHFIKKLGKPFYPCCAGPRGQNHHGL